MTICEIRLDGGRNLSGREYAIIFRKVDARNLSSKVSSWGLGCELWRRAVLLVKVILR